MLFLFLEDDNIIILENVVALVRRDGGTRVLLRCGNERESGFTPLVIDRRSRNFGNRGDGRGIKMLNGGNLRHG
ncbi:MAG: hypothetical protein LBB28_04255 [Synergistaceae bacterium]|nr:hypothetical protein [Synergistaceae bacterium]